MIRPDIKNDFPFLTKHSDAIYLDSSSTSQKPKSVIDTLHYFYNSRNANAGRGTYPLSTTLTRQIENIRTQVQQFIHAESAHEIIFTNGATDAQGKIAQSFLTYLKDKDEILYSTLDHRSFVLPWIRVQKQLAQFGKHVKLIPYSIKQTGDANIDDLLSKISSRTKLINITHIHNVFGSDSDIYRLKKVREQGVIINVDGAQSVGHSIVDVKKIGADVLSFSGHKMFASLGTGVLYIEDALQNKLGEFTPQELGTKDYAGILTLGEAITYIENIGINNIHKHLVELTQYAIQLLKRIPGIQFTKGIAHSPRIDGYGIVSFNIDGFNPMDIAFFLADQKIMVRAGDHCSLTPGDEVNAVRVSMHIYNSKNDIDVLVKKLTQYFSTFSRKL
jgi:cysteine desulfurase/selenocysteine lyase